MELFFFGLGITSCGEKHFRESNNCLCKESTACTMRKRNDHLRKILFPALCHRDRSPDYICILIQILCCTFVHFYGHFLQMSHMATESFWGEIANQEFLRIIEHLEVYTYVFKLYSSCSYFQCRFFASECCPKIQNHFTVSFAGDH